MVDYKGQDGECRYPKFMRYFGNMFPTSVFTTFCLHGSKHCIEISCLLNAVLIDLKVVAWLRVPLAEFH